MMKLRFWKKVKKTPTCWLWAASTDKDGYGRMGYAGRVWLAHRISWDLTNGPIPDGSQVLHRCDIRACVRPSHLFLGSHQDNMRDRASKGRFAPKGVRNPRAKLTERQVQKIRLLRTNGSKAKDIAASFGISSTMVSLICSGKNWSHV